MSATEILWRTRSALRDQADLIRTPLNLIPRLPDDFDFKSLQESRGFSCTDVGSDDWDNLPRYLREPWEARLLAKANALLENRLSYFDVDNAFHGDPFDWHRDLSSDTKSPLRHVSLTDYRNASVFGDCKLVWEPNRHHQLVVLARAHRISRDARYADKVATLMRSWLDANPFGYGMNWKSPLEVGIRLINWVWTIDLLRGNYTFDDALWRDMSQALYRAMWDTHRKFSHGSSANTHLIGEAAGVFVAASYFCDMPNAHQWRRDAQDILEREIIRQSFEDGCTREHAFGYQFFVLQFFALYSLTLAKCGQTVPEKLKARIGLMYRFLHEVCRDTGQPPGNGDRDDGYVLDLGEIPDDAEKLISVGAYLSGDLELLSSVPAETCFWMFGEIRHRSSEPSPAEPVNFAQSGYSILRADQAAFPENAISIFFDTAELGFGSIAAHGHADALSICLSVGRDPVIVDPGTYDYFTFPAWRDYFRSTRAHNTIEIDGLSQSVSLGPFLWGLRANTRQTDWHSTANTCRASGEHDGYERLREPVTHRRCVTVDRLENKAVITDQLSGRGCHEARLHLHLHPDCDAKLVSPHRVRVRTRGSFLYIDIEGAEFEIVEASNSLMLGWFSDGYHRKRQSRCLLACAPFTDNHEMRLTFTVA